MADNYLEKKMEEHRLGKTAMGKFSRKPSQGYFALKMAGIRVLVIGDVTSQADACIRRLIGSGCKVAFCDQSRGTEYAQKSGALFIPASDITEAFSRAVERWGGIDVVLLTEAIGQKTLLAFRNCDVGRVIGLGSPFPEGMCDVVLNIKETEDAAVANLCVVMCHPSTYCIKNLNICLR